MKKIFTLILSIALSGMGFAFNKPVTPADQLPAFYERINGTSGKELLDSIQQVAKVGYRTEDFRNQVSMLLQGTTGNVELYAKFTLTVYTIDYDLDGGIMTEDNAVTSYTVKDEVVLIDAWKAHYTFEGWYADAKFENAVESFNVNQAANVTLYAKFEPVKYSITWVANGGILEEGAITEYTVDAPEYGPKYFAPSSSLFLVIKIRG